MDQSDKSAKQPVILLTGGAGFLGRAIVRELLDEGSPLSPIEVRVYDQAESPGYTDSRVTYIKGDILDRELLSRSCEGVSLVIHAAAIVDWGTRSDEEVLAVNFHGTENVVDACRENSVEALIYTSSLDAVYSGKPLVDVDETLDYPEKHATTYCRSKYLAEKLVLAENQPEFKTCALRPSDIYGEDDPFHIESLINMARGGFYIRLGDGKARNQHVYVGNMAHAHVIAADAILYGNEKIAGNAYFITDGPGANFFRFFDPIVTGAGYRIWPKNLWLPRKFAYTLGTISEYIAYLLRPVKYYTPKLSRFAVTYTCTDYTFNSEKARDHFGWVPRYSKEEAVARCIRHYHRSNKKKKSDAISSTSPFL